MSLRNIILVVILGLVLLGAIVGEGYFYFTSQRENGAVNSVIQSIQKSLSTKPTLDVLAEARSNLQAQTEKLKEMQASFPSSPVLDAAIKADVAKAAAAAALADTLAADPKLDIPAGSNIIILGQKATEALAYLQYLLTTPASTAALNDAAQNAIDLVAAYVNQLDSYVNSLSPSGSNLTSGDIADYQSQTSDIVGQVNSIENSLNQIDSIPASSVPGITSPADIPLAVSTSTNNSGNGGSSNSSGGAQNSSAPDQSSNQSPGQPSGGTSNPSDGSVTLGDIVDQQNVVSDDTNQVNQLADQSGSDTASSSDSSDSQDTGNTNGGVYTGGDNNSGGIQSQDGPVKLIEGENTF